MAQIGLKETLSLLAAGYKKKDIEALAAIDEQTEQVVETETPAPETPAITKEDEDKMNELLAQIKEKEEQLEKLTQAKEAAEAKVTKLQQDNIHKDSSPAVEESKKEQQDSLLNLVRGFM